jgi:hypothetical protein
MLDTILRLRRSSDEHGRSSRLRTLDPFDVVVSHLGASRRLRKDFVHSVESVADGGDAHRRSIAVAVAWLPVSGSGPMEESQTVSGVWTGHEVLMKCIDYARPFSRQSATATVRIGGNAIV